MQRIAVLTSGGDAPGMNAALRAVVRCAASHGVETIGVESGYRGLIEGDLRPLGPRDVSNIIQQGGTVIGTSRSRRFMTPEGRTEAATWLAKAGVEGLVVIGGNGSFRGAAALAEEHGTAVVGVPATIDNDIGGSETTIGFDTAVNTALEAIDRLRDTAFSLDRVFFVEVMGRHCGAIALSSALAGGAEEVLIPERPDEIPRLLQHIREARERGKQSLIVVVAEGEESGGAEGVAAAVTRELNLEVRVTILGHTQRGGSPTAADRILGSRLGSAATEALIRGDKGLMTSIRGGKVELVPLERSWEDSYLPTAELLDLCERLAQ